MHAAHVLLCSSDRESSKQFQGGESFRKMKLRMNTDANVEMSHDPSIKAAVYVKPPKKINEHGSDCGNS
jgi:hypothetical protein